MRRCNVHRQKRGMEASSPGSAPRSFRPADIVWPWNRRRNAQSLQDCRYTPAPWQIKDCSVHRNTRGEGTSTIVREFGRVAADLIGNSVLLLDADRHHSSQGRFFDIERSSGWLDALKGEGLTGDLFHRVGESTLFVSPSCNSAGYTPEMFDSRFDSMCQNLRKDFDMVLIDCAHYDFSRRLASPRK